MQTDPAGSLADANLYRYAYNDSSLVIDPRGDVGLVGVGIGAAIGGVSGYMATGTWQGALGGAAIGGAAGFFGQFGASARAGVLVGALVGGGENLAWQTVVQGKSLQCVDKGEIAKSAILGGVTGGIGHLARVANSGARLPAQEVGNYIGKPQRILLTEGETLYGVRDAGSRSVWWTRVSPQGELQWRMDQAVLNEWNQGTHVETLTIPKGKALIGFEGPARAQGPYLGGGNQVYIPNVPNDWSTIGGW